MDEKITNVPEIDDEELGVVELTDDEGKVLKFFHIGTIVHNERWFAFFQPAEEMDGVDEEEVVIFEIVDGESGEALAPVEDEELLDEVYAAFIKEMEECDDECDCDCDDDDCNCGDENDGGCCKNSQSKNHSCGCGCDHNSKK